MMSIFKFTLSSYSVHKLLANERRKLELASDNQHTEILIIMNLSFALSIAVLNSIFQLRAIRSNEKKRATVTFYDP